MAVLLAAPFINMLALAGGARWLGAYGVVAAMGAVAAAWAVALTVALFRSIGPRRTRLVAQIVAAVIGAAFVIGLQVAAILSYGTLSRFASLQSPWLLAHVPGDRQPGVVAGARRARRPAWRCAGARRSRWRCSAARSPLFSPRFGDHAIAAAGVSQTGVRQRHARLPPRARPAALRRKEWTLLRARSLAGVADADADPLSAAAGAAAVAQLRRRHAALVVLVPVLVMAAGQLAGGLAWLAISGEDAPDLVATAPIAARSLHRARQDRGRDRAYRAGLRAVRRGARRCLAMGGGWSRALGVLVAAASATADPALVPHAGAAQPFPPPPDLLARRDLRRSLLVDLLGGGRGAGRGRELAGLGAGAGGARHPGRRGLIRPPRA